MIEVKNLTRVFNKKQDSGFGIRNVSFTISNGDIVAFVGDNGYSLCPNRIIGCSPWINYS